VRNRQRGGAGGEEKKILASKIERFGGGGKKRNGNVRTVAGRVHRGRAAEKIRGCAGVRIVKGCGSVARGGGGERKGLKGPNRGDETHYGTKKYSRETILSGEGGGPAENCCAPGIRPASTKDLEMGGKGRGGGRPVGGKKKIFEEVRKSNSSGRQGEGGGGTAKKKRCVSVAHRLWAE